MKKLLNILMLLAITSSLSISAMQVQRPTTPPQNNQQQNNQNNQQQNNQNNQNKKCPNAPKKKNGGKKSLLRGRRPNYFKKLSF